jgi:hypothetical protein
MFSCSFNVVADETAIATIAKATFPADVGAISFCGTNWLSAVADLGQ